jgi:hypothetical protein
MSNLYQILLPFLVRCRLGAFRHTSTSHAHRIGNHLRFLSSLPVLAGISALTRHTGAERRQMVAHGVSRGYRSADVTSPGGAKELVVRALFHHLTRFCV